MALVWALALVTVVVLVVVVVVEEGAGGGRGGGVALRAGVVAVRSRPPIRV